MSMALCRLKALYTFQFVYLNKEVLYENERVGLEIK
jgi:hypothetical protein